MNAIALCWELTVSEILLVACPRYHLELPVWRMVALLSEIENLST